MSAVEEVRPGVTRLELPMPGPETATVNAWLLAAGGGAVLVDTGLHAPGTFERLTAALAEAGASLGDLLLVACTHAHADHAGQAAAIARAAGCELWLHPDHRHGTAPVTDRTGEVARRLVHGVRCGVPGEALRRLGAAVLEQDVGFAGVPRPDRLLVDGVEVVTDAGSWRVVETPGHAPSHVCLFESATGMLLSGDHVLARSSASVEQGWTPDPVGELLASLKRVRDLGVRLCLPGHGPAFEDAAAAISAMSDAMLDRLDGARAALVGGARSAVEVAREVYSGTHGKQAAWMFAEALCLLEHLERRGEIRVTEPLRWAPARPAPPTTGA